MNEGAGRLHGVYAFIGLSIFIAVSLSVLSDAQAAPQLPGGPDGYAYRVTVSTNSSFNQTNIQVPFTLNTQSLITAGKLRSDCADLRARSTSAQDIGLWLETGCNTTTTRVWILVPFVPTGSNNVAHIYYGNPNATSSSSVNATFYENAIRAEMRDCDPSLNNSYCPITSHTQADAIRSSALAFCGINVTKIEWGHVCSGNAPGTDGWSNSGTVYRFLFLPDVNGSWGFQTRADNWSELMTSTTDEALINFHSPIVSNYGDVHTNLTGSLTMTADRARWMSFVASDRNGPEEQTLWIRRPGGSYQLATTSNFPGMFLARKYPTSGAIVASLGTEFSAAPAPTGDAQGKLNATGYNVTFNWMSDGAGALCRVWARNSFAGNWTILHNATANAMGQCTFLNQTSAGLAPNTTRQYMAYFTKAGWGDGRPLFLNATTYGPPHAPIVTGSTRSNHTIEVFLTPAQAQGVPVTGHKAFVSVNGSAFTQWGTIAGNATSYTIGNATNGVNHSFYFVGTSSLGDGPASNVGTFRTWTVPYPSTLSVSTGNTTAQLSWTPGFDGGSPLQGHRVYVNDVVYTDVAAQNGSALNITGLTNGVAYSFHVRAANEAGFGNPSNVVNATPGHVPWPPEDLEAMRGDSFVFLGWEYPYDELNATPLDGGYPITHYSIWRGTSPGTTSFVTNVSEDGFAGWNDTNVTNGVTYYYNVTATNALGTSPTTYEVSARPATTPSAPLNLVGVAGNHTVSLTWSAPSSNGGEPITNYIIWGGLETDTETDDFALTGGANTSFVVNGLLNGVNWKFNVSAINAVGEGASSAILHNMMPGARPDPVEDLEAFRGNGFVFLGWEDPVEMNGEIANFSIWRGTSPGVRSFLTTIPAEPAPVNGGTYNDTNVTNGVTYYYNVTATNAFGMSASSYEVSARPATIPSAPTSFALTPGNRTITLSWQPPLSDGGEPITNYSLWGALASDSQTDDFALIGTNTSYVVHLLDGYNGVPFKFNVTPVNAVGDGASTPILTSAAGEDPYPPGNLTATRANGKVTLEWTPGFENGAPLDNYSIWVGTASGATTFFASTGSGANTSFVVNGLTNGQLYYFNVSAHNSFGWSNSSNEASARPATTPGEVGSFAGASGNRSVTLTWTAAASGGEPILRHHVYRGTTSSTTLLATIGEANTSFVVNDLANGTLYYFNVTAENVLGNGTNSAFALVTPAARPDPPANLVATRGNANVTLTWTPGLANGMPLAGYDIWRGTSPGTETMIAQTTNGSNTSFVANDLTNGQLYYFNVTARNSVGMSVTSNEVSARPATTPNAPVSPGGARGNRSASLSWSAPAANGGEPITNYHVYMGTSSSTTYLASTGGTNTSFVANNLQNGTQYFFNVSAVNVVGNGTSSAQFTVIPAARPDPPANLVATRGNANVTLTWTPGLANGDALVGYNVWRGASQGAETMIAQTTNGANTSFVVNGLTNGQTYWFNVTSRNNVGMSASSNHVSALPATAPSEPGSLTAWAVNHSVVLNWTAPSANGGEPLLGYKIFAEPTPPSGSLDEVATTTNPSNLSFTVFHRVNGIPLVNGTAYTFQVRAYNGAGNGTNSSQTIATPGAPPDPPILSASYNNASVALSWSYHDLSPAQIDAIKIYRGTSPGGAKALFATLLNSNTSFDDQNAVNGQTYCYTMQARRTNYGWGNGSNEVCGTPSTIPNPPGSLVATRGNGNVTLTWTPGTNGTLPLTNYHVYRGATSGVRTYLASTGTGTNTSFVVNGLTNGQPYYFSVTVQNARGNSTHSNEATATPATTPSMPSFFAATPANMSVALNWTAGSNGGNATTSWRIYKNATGTTELAEIDNTGNGANATFTVNGLANNVTYRFAVRPVNGVGEGALSSVVTATPRGPPRAPTNLLVPVNNASAQLTWTGSVGNGSDVTHHRIYRNDTAIQTLATPTNAYLDTGLANGVRYQYCVVGINAAGEGVATCTNVTPASRPDPVAFTSATRGDASVTLGWTPGDARGSPLVRFDIYRGTSAGGAAFYRSAANTSTSFLDTNVTNGVTYYYNLTASNAMGTSNTSVERNAHPAAAPGAPTLTQVARGNQSLTAFWSAPASNGGEPLAGYDIRVYPQGGAASAWEPLNDPAEASRVKSGLTNGVSYVVEVRARNVIGAGLPSGALTGIPAGAPYPPALASALRGNGNVTLTWTNGSHDGSAITSTRILRGGAPNALSEIASVSPGNTSFVVNGLTNGQTYYFALRHENAAGMGNLSNVRSAMPATTPNAPTGLTATRGNGSVTLSWTPGANGGELLTDHEIFRGPAGGTLVRIANTSSGSNTSFTANGLANGVAYEFQVRAANVVGFGPMSGSVTATPAAIPDPPALASATRGNANVTLTWTPGNAQGNATTGYRLLQGTSPSTMSDVGPIAASNTSTIVSGLTNGVTYYFALKQQNDLGTGNPSNVRDAKPATTPSAPSTPSATFGDARVSLSWNAGATGGEPIANYTIHMGSSAGNVAPLATIGSNTSYVAHGLVNGQTYFFRISAANVVGAGPTSTAVSATPGRVPDAPTDLDGQTGSHQVSLDWSAPANNGGRPLTGYVILRAQGTGSYSDLDTIGTNTSYVAAGLIDGVTYRFKVVALNDLGRSAESNEVSGTPYSPPGAPSTIDATKLEPAINVTWGPPSTTGGMPVGQYRVFASETPGGTKWLVATVPGTQRWYVDAAEPSTVRYYVVRALTLAGEGPASDEAMGMVPANILDPPDPDTYRTCTRDDTTEVVACTQGSSQATAGIAAAGRYTCIILDDGRVDCYGENGANQSNDHLAGRPAVAVSASGSHTCIVLDNGNVDCYGNNAYGKAASYLGGDAIGAAAGGTHTCFVRSNGAATCQGSNADGQSAGRTSGVLKAAAGVYHTCFLLAGGTVDCQGLNDRGQAADDNLGGVTQVVAGRFHTCALTSGGVVRCWGHLAQPTPTNVNGTAIAIASGKDHVCALLSTQRVECWGATRDGQSADYSGTGAAAPVAIAAGDSHSCARLADAQGSIVCWGAEGLTDEGQARAYPTDTSGTEPEASPGASTASVSLFPDTDILITDLTRVRLARAEGA